MPDEIKPTPRGTLAGMLADALSAVDSKLPKLASEVVGIPSMARTMDRISYGEPLTTGRGMTLKPREDTMNALMGVAPFLQGAKAAAPLARKGAAAAVQNALAPTSPGMAQRGAIVYHGSPHTFDKFDMSKIGTGEGAQAYGHGLYFADHPDVAMGYAPRDPKFEGRIMSAYKQAETRQLYPAMEVHEAYLLHKTPLEVEQMIKGMEGLSPAERAAVKQAHEYGKKQYQKQAGSLYKVDLPDEHIAKMLDWDKPLSQQPELVGALEKAGVFNGRKTMGPPDQQWESHIGPGGVYVNANDPAQRAYIAAQQHMGADKATVAFKQAGIPGIKYLDQGSRGAGDGTRNYVVFDDKLPKILERNGKSLAEQLADKLK